MTGPVGVEPLATCCVDSFEGVGAEVVALGLDEVGGETFAAVGIEVSECGAEGGGGQAEFGGGGDDAIDGGADNDTVTYTGLRSDYTITDNAGVYTIVDNRPGSPDGTDTVTGVENFQFADGTVSSALLINEAPTDIQATLSSSLGDRKSVV